MNADNRFASLLRRLTVGFLALAIVLSISACATKPALVWHQFSFDGWFDGWAKQVDLLEYSYGDQYHMVRRAIGPGGRTLGYSSGVNGPMPVGDFLYVKWRLKDTSEVMEDRVELRELLPKDMTGHGVTFVIDGRQLYIYVMTPQARDSKLPRPLKTYLSRYNETYEIYPTNTSKR